MDLVQLEDNMRDLIPKPQDRVKSFYGKAKIQDIHHSLYGDGEALYSYDTEIIRKYGNTLIQVAHPSVISVTTSRHLYSFCGLRKKDYTYLYNNIINNKEL